MKLKVLLILVFTLLFYTITYSAIPPANTITTFQEPTGSKQITIEELFYFDIPEEETEIPWFLVLYLSCGIVATTLRVFKTQQTGRF
jgi:hypothetical protein